MVVLGGLARLARPELRVVAAVARAHALAWVALVELALLTHQIPLPAAVLE
jgi:hypothetical protein